MTEAKITCLCRHFQLAELGLDLRQGEEAWVAEEAARQSPEIANHARIGAVQVEYLERWDMRGNNPGWKGNRVPVGPNKTEGTPSVPVTPAIVVVPSMSPAPPPTPSPNPSPVTPMQMDILQELRSLRKAFQQWAQNSQPAPPPAPTAESPVRAEILEELRELKKVCRRIESNLADLVASQRTLPASILGAVQALSASVSQTISRTPASATPRSSEETDPVFIPSGIVDKSQSVSVNSAEGSGGLDSAAAQLRALRKSADKDEE